jgi:hypothetical protein
MDAWLAPGKQRMGRARERQHGWHALPAELASSVVGAAKRITGAVWGQARRRDSTPAAPQPSSSTGEPPESSRLVLCFTTINVLRLVLLSFVNSHHVLRSFILYGRCFRFRHTAQQGPPPLPRRPILRHPSALHHQRNGDLKPSSAVSPCRPY